MTTEANNAISAGRALMGRMTPAERSAGRFLRSPDGHPDAPPPPSEPPAGEPPAATEPPAQNPESPPPAPEAPPAHVRPEGIPDEFWDDATGLKVGDLATAYRELTAKEAERTADVPAEAEAYDLALPEDFEKPEGFEVEIKADDPLWAGFQALGKKYGLSRAAFTEFVGEFAKYQIQNAQADVESYVAAKTALGANAETRIKAAESWLGVNLPKAEAQALGGALITADGIKAVERLIALKSGPRATEGAGASSVNEFEGLHGGDLLDAVRTKQSKQSA